MKDYLISMFIDNELDLDEKINFVQTVHEEQTFTNEAIELLEQEKLLHARMVHQVPRMQIPVEKEPIKRLFAPLIRPVALFSTGLALGAALLLIQPGGKVPLPIPASVASREIPYRFIIYRPDTKQADIIGTFTHWQPVAMEKMGGSGYWSLTLNLPEGEYQYSFVAEGQQITDPTVSERVQDDFGGENSILTIKV